MPQIINGLLIDDPEQVVSLDHLQAFVDDFNAQPKANRMSPMSFIQQWGQKNLPGDQSNPLGLLVTRYAALERLIADLPGDLVLKSPDALNFQTSLLAAAAVSPLYPENGKLAFRLEELVKNARTIILQWSGKGASPAN